MYHQDVKRFGSRSGPTLAVGIWVTRSELFAMVRLSADDKVEASKELNMCFGCSKEPSD